MNNQQGDKHADPEDEQAPAVAECDEPPRAGEEGPQTMLPRSSLVTGGTATDTDTDTATATDGPSPAHLARFLQLQRLQSAQGNRALSHPGSLLPHQQQPLAGRIPSSDAASLLKRDGQRPTIMDGPAGPPSSSLESLIQAMSTTTAPAAGAPPHPSCMMNQAMMMNQAILMNQVMMMKLAEITQWNNGGQQQFLDSDGLGRAVRAHAISNVSGRPHGVKVVVESSNDRHIIQTPAAAPPPEEVLALTNRPAIPISMDGDEAMLTPYQCLVREHIELFEAGALDIRGTAQGRNTQLVLGQVGVRCRHCAGLPLFHRARGAVYYSQTIEGLYQVVQNMSKQHLLEQCHLVPREVRHKLNSFRRDNQRASGGKEYWAQGFRTLGVYRYERGRCLRFQKPVVTKEESSVSWERTPASK